jgi:hypothetical protein
MSDYLWPSHKLAKRTQKAEVAGNTPRCGRSDGHAVRGACGGVGAEHVGQRGPHGQDQDRQAEHDSGDGHGARAVPGLGQQVVGDLLAMPNAKEQIAMGA